MEKNLKKYIYMYKMAKQLIYVYISKSLWCTPEINITLYFNCISTIKKKKKETGKKRKLPSIYNKKEPMTLFPSSLPN